MAKVQVNDRNGDPMANFNPSDDESLGIQAQDAGAPIPFSCGVGACRTCLCQVKSGLEYIDTEGVGPQQIPTEEGEILSCIATLKSDAPEDAEIVLDAQNL